MKTKVLIYIIIMVLAAAPGAFAAKQRKAAKPRFTAEELTQQARQAFYDYDVETAREKIAALKADKKADADLIASLNRQVERMDEMIQRVQDIAIIDSINVDRAEFFRHYRLSPSAGRLLTVAEAGQVVGAAAETAVYLPEDGSLMLWGTDKGLVESRRLTDGSWEAPRRLGDDINAGGIANYPFLLSDGSTLYFATDGDDSLGGLDIYITQLSRDGAALPQNLGMPYNSPYDDYMLAIDEETGAGWFATDRNQLGDKVTIYIFIPAETRVNINVDDPELAARARIDSPISPLSAEQSALLKRIAEIDSAADFGDADTAPDFEFPLPDGRVLTRWEEFRSPQARRLMETYVDAMADSEADNAALEKLRATYKPGNSAAKKQILSLENRADANRRQLKSLANQVIQAETAR